MHVVDLNDYAVYVLLKLLHNYAPDSKNMHSKKQDILYVNSLEFCLLLSEDYFINVLLH